ncbi:MAG: HAMP domain-containing protein [Caldilineaceae bacterium]|nr:HAMP domain-containing protein [Caldilineaceae bacterium]
MNRLGVRLSIVMGGLILLFTILPLFTFLIFPPKVMNNQPHMGEARPPGPQRFFDPWRDLPENVMESILLAGVVGIAGGVAASWILAAPITKLANAAQAIGAGDLSVRVDLKHNSAEIDALAQAFNKMAADLQHAAELRNNLMADVSHELRTPLTVLEGNLRAALDHVYELDDEQIANLYEQTRHLIRLVSELRELTLAEAAQLPLDQQPLDLRLLVQETVAVFEPLAEEQQVQLVVQGPTALPLVNADHARMRQVLHNLLANALRHSPTNGRVTLALTQTTGRVRLTVQDTGDGIDPQQISHIFDRFYRTDPSRSRETGGSGLGLAIVKAIVEAHGGEVTASSAGVGMGTRFTIWLPSL